jgi:hypothetical protein
MYFVCIGRFLVVTTYFHLRPIIHQEFGKKICLFIFREDLRQVRNEARFAEGKRLIYITNKLSVDRNHRKWNNPHDDGKKNKKLRARVGAR